MTPTQSPLIIDVAGPRLGATDRARLRHPLVGGVTLFGRNWQDREQLRSLCADIKAVRGDLLILVDHEGGRVQRFRSDGFTHLPPMRALGQMWQDSVPGDPQASALCATRAATACGLVMGAELRACGVDMSYAPVLDLDHGASGVIGDRAFARAPAVVALLAKSFMHGLLQSGMANCGKHFPGHGFAAADSHTDVVVDRRGLKAILADDAAPYGWLGTALAAVMPAHVVYPRVDARPAGFSRKWLGDILRGRLGFAGAIFSDDLGMAAARRLDGAAVGYAQAAVAALQAGCDMVLLCNQSAEGNDAIDLLIDGMVRARDDGLWLPVPAGERRRRSLLPSGAAADWDALMADPLYQRARALVP